MERVAPNFFKRLSKDEDPELSSIHPEINDQRTFLPICDPQYHSRQHQNIKKPIPLKFHFTENNSLLLFSQTGENSKKNIFLSLNCFITPKKKIGLFEGSIPKTKRFHNFENEMPPLKKQLFS